MRLTRRSLLSGSGLLIATALGGCSYTYPSHIDIGVAIAEPFDSSGPVSVPVTVNATMQQSDSTAIGLAGVTLESYGRDFDRLASHDFGELRWETADSTDETDVDSGLLGSDRTEYTAQWTRKLTLDTGAVPAWITFSIDDYWFKNDERQAALLVGGARAEPQTEVVTATALRYDGPDPPPETVGSDHYTSYIERDSEPADLSAYDPVAPDSANPDKVLDSLALTLEGEPMDGDETIAVGETKTVRTRATYADGSTTNVTEQAPVESSDPAVASMSIGGRRVSGERTGTVELSARYRGETATAELQVVESSDD